MSDTDHNNNYEKLVKERDILRQKALSIISFGVDVKDPNRLDIRGKLDCGKNVSIDINVIIEGFVILEDNVTVGANTIIRNCSIGKGTVINPFSLLEDSVIGDFCVIGPYGRIRPKVKISDYVQIGNFVEIKNSKIGSKSRINHLSFIGDADLSEDVTIGAGTITCNHDGVRVNTTQIKNGAYIGSGSNLIAPLTVNSYSTVAAGSTITKNVPGNTLTIARSPQVTVNNWQRPNPDEMNTDINE